MTRPSPDFLAVWAAFETANARAADMYEALPITGRGVRIPKCECGAVALLRCRVCRRLA